MEGLIPFIYRAIKRRRSRTYYKCLSYGAAQRFNTTYNFHDQNQKFLPSDPLPPPRFGSFREDRKAHRRRHTMQDFSDEVFSPEDDYQRRGRLPKDVRSRSMRILSCIGAAL
ncbi:uncharacterized protein [Typha latifolia]|uniref:uncharacterized protein n=1 Tax=Typha latifolia TaxID=4733 RepID=UPI003C2D3E50